MPTWPSEIASTLNAAFGDKQGLEDQHINSGAPLFVPAKPIYASDGQQNAAFSTDQALSLTATREQGYVTVPHTVGPLTAGMHKGPRGTEAVEINHVIAFAQNTRNEIRKINGDGAITGALAANPGMKQTTYIAIPADLSGTQAASAQNISPTLSVKHETAVAWSIMPMNSGKDYKARVTDVAQPLMAGGPVGGNQGGDFVQASAVRRLTPVECERLQGFPDNYTQIEWRNKPAESCPDGPRYKAMGNSMAVPVMRWIGERISMVDAL